MPQKINANKSKKKRKRKWYSRYNGNKKKD